MSEDTSARGFAKADLPSIEPVKGAKLKDRNDRDVSIGSTVEIPYHKGEEGKIVYVDEATGMVYVKMPAPILRGLSGRVTCKSKCGRAPKSAAAENGGTKGSLAKKLATAFEEIRELKKSLAANASKTRKAEKSKMVKEKEPKIISPKVEEEEEPKKKSIKVEDNEEEAPEKPKKKSTKPIKVEEEEAPEKPKKKSTKPIKVEEEEENE